MNIQRLRDELRKHPIFEQDIDPQMNMGLPIIEKKENAILLSFLLHEESIDEDKIAIYPAAYWVSFELPSLKLVEFKNLIVLSGVDTTIPAAVEDTEYIMGSGAEIIDELYKWFEASLATLPYPELADHAIKSYQGIFRDAVEALGLEKLYEESF